MNPQNNMPSYTTNPSTPATNQMYNLPQGYPPITPGSDKPIMIIGIIIGVMYIVGLISLFTLIPAGIKSAQDSAKNTQDETRNSRNYLTTPTVYPTDTISTPTDNSNISLSSLSKENNTNFNLYYPRSFTSVSSTPTKYVYKNASNNASMYMSITPVGSSNYLTQDTCKSLSDNIASSASITLTEQAMFNSQGNVTTCTFSLKSNAGIDYSIIKQRYFEKSGDNNLYILQTSSSSKTDISDKSDLELAFNNFSFN